MLKRQTLGLIPALLLTTLVAGCATVPRATTAQITYETTPEGATIYEGGQSIGVAPVTRTYPAGPGGETVRTPTVTAVWPSGAKESYYTIVPVGSDRVATIERPSGAPQLQKDLDHAKQFAAAKRSADQKAREAMQRDLNKGSDRCKQQMARGGALAGADDCN